MFNCWNLVLYYRHIHWASLHIMCQSFTCDFWLTAVDGLGLTLLHIVFVRGSYWNLYPSPGNRKPRWVADTEREGKHIFSHTYELSKYTNPLKCVELISCEAAESSDCIVLPKMPLQRLWFKLRILIKIQTVPMETTHAVFYQKNIKGSDSWKLEMSSHL